MTSQQPRERYHLCMRVRTYLCLFPWPQIDEHLTCSIYHTVPRPHTVKLSIICSRTSVYACVHLCLLPLSQIDKHLDRSIYHTIPRPHAVKLSIICSCTSVYACIYLGLLPLPQIDEHLYSTVHHAIPRPYACSLGIQTLVSQNFTQLSFRRSNV